MIVQTDLDVYSSIPITFKGRGSKELLVGFLSQNKDVWFKSTKLARIAGFHVRSGQIELRKAITELLIDGCPIVAGGKGFMWTESQLEIDRYLSNLYIRREGLERRILAVRKCLRMV